jgi:D-3-phosphoglycerate dehydrogenase / 2-oxoglutarate reductase
MPVASRLPESWPGEPELRRMKPTAILINTACGPIVSDEALYRALSEHWIAGAGLGDIEEEHAKQVDWTPRNPLFRLDNVIITMHAAYYSEEGASSRHPLPSRARPEAAPHRR